jgi:hypothetical protein
MPQVISSVLARVVARARGRVTGSRVLLPTVVALAVGACLGEAAVGQNAPVGQLAGLERNAAAGQDAAPAKDAGAAGETVPSGNVVYLDEAALARLRITNPNHYVRARKVMDAANELCKPGPAELTFTQAGARQVACKRVLLKTSNPPKREISFRLDQTRYVAVVVITDDPARLVNAN